MDAVQRDRVNDGVDALDGSPDHLRIARWIVAHRSHSHACGTYRSWYGTCWPIKSDR